MNFTTEMIALLGIITDFALIAGLFIICAAIFRLKKHGEMRGAGGGQSKVGGAFVWIFIGAVLLALPTFLHLFLWAIWGQTNPTMYPGGDDPTLGPIRQRVVMLVIVFGVGMFVKALMTLSKLGSEQVQPGTAGKAVLYFIVSAVCINIYPAANLMIGIIHAITPSMAPVN